MGDNHNAIEAFRTSAGAVAGAVAGAGRSLCRSAGRRLDSGVESEDSAAVPSRLRQVQVQ